MADEPRLYLADVVSDPESGPLVREVLSQERPMFVYSPIYENPDFVIIDEIMDGLVIPIDDSADESRLYPGGYSTTAAASREDWTPVDYRPQPRIAVEPATSPQSWAFPIPVGPDPETVRRFHMLYPLCGPMRMTLTGGRIMTPEEQRALEQPYQVYYGRSPLEYGCPSMRFEASIESSDVLGFFRAVAERLGEEISAGLNEIITAFGRMAPTSERESEPTIGDGFVQCGKAQIPKPLYYARQRVQRRLARKDSFCRNSKEFVRTMYRRFGRVPA